MARKPSPEQEQAKKLYLDSGGQMPLVEIAKAVGKSPEQIRKWKSTGKWDDDPKGNVTKTKSNVTESEEQPRSAPAPPILDEPPENDEPDNGSLTPKQRRFVQEYLIDLNATQAAIRAGYSVKSADKIGSELLGKTRVAEAVERGMSQRAQRLQIDADWVLRRLVRLADYDVRDFAHLATVKRIFETKGGDPLEDEVQVVLINPEFDGTIAKSLNQDKDGIKLEMPDRIRALELIGKHIGVFTDPHKRRIDEERLQLDRERIALERNRSGGDSGAAKEGLRIEVDYGDGDET